MLGSIYIGLSGLTAYSNGLKEVSNNVSNLNSVGFKSSTVTFSNLESTLRGGPSIAGNGTNTSGQGVRLDDTTIDFNPGELRQTNRDLDLAVDGTGFLILMREEDVRYVRTGNFEIDKDGYIAIAGSEYRLAMLNAAGQAVTVSTDALRTNPPQATTRIVLAENLSSGALGYTLGDVAVYDASGKKNTWQIAFSRADVTKDWLVKITDQDGKTVGEKTLGFVAGKPDPANAKLAYTTASGASVELDFSANVTSFSAGTVSTLRIASADGHAVGSIASMLVNEKGELEIGYSNGEKASLGTVALVNFREPQLLERQSDGLFLAPDSAEPQLLSTEDPRVGSVVSRRLEASNVDLSRQFGDLIMIQRGYQASSQIISASNDMIQQLFGIRGQG